jgi:hypothetical protein
MSLLARYLRHLAFWTAGLTALLLLSGLSVRDSPWTLPGRLPGLATFAMILACFPAGISVGARVFSDPRTFPGEGAKLLLGTALSVGLALLLIQLVVPLSLANSRVAGRGDPVELREMTAPELRAYGRPLVMAAEQSSAGDLETWRRANTFALTWLGALVAPWASRIRHREARIAQLLGQGLFLIVGIYLGGENGYELVAAQAAGQAYFAAWFIVFVPALLGAGLGWPTLVQLYTQPHGAADPARAVGSSA